MKFVIEDRRKAGIYSLSPLSVQFKENDKSPTVSRWYVYCDKIIFTPANAPSKTLESNGTVN